MSINVNLSDAPTIACDLTAIPAEQREGHLQIAQKLLASVLEVQELSDGYALRLPAESEMLLNVAQYIANERLCCPFFDFTLKVGAQNSGIWLWLTGGGEVKLFTRLEIASHLNP
jgi:hypothetical protein